MKKNFFLVISLFLTVSLYSQSYGYVYAYNPESKILYISNCVRIDVDKYDKCVPKNREQCFALDFVNSLKEAVGSKYSSYIVVPELRDYVYGIYTSIDAVEIKIKATIAHYRVDDYTVHKFVL